MDGLRAGAVAAFPPAPHFSSSERAAQITSLEEFAGKLIPVSESDSEQGAKGLGLAGFGGEVVLLGGRR